MRKWCSRFMACPFPLPASLLIVLSIKPSQLGADARLTKPSTPCGVFPKGLTLEDVHGSCQGVRLSGRPRKPVFGCDLRAIVKRWSRRVAMRLRRFSGKMSDGWTR